MKRVLNPYIFITLISVAGLIGIFSIRSMEMTRSVARDGIAMDTVVQINLFASKSKSELSAILDEAFELLDSLEERISMHDPGSQISMINLAAGRASVSVDPEIYSLLKMSTEFASLTSGAFDPTIGSVTELWKKYREGSEIERPSLPQKSDLAYAAKLVDYKAMEFLDSGEVFLRKKGMAIDLGGIGKGYASAALAELFSSHSINSALVDLGGNVVAIGCKPDGAPWRIGVQDPKAARGTPLLALEICNASVITAGVYERSWEIEGTEYTHIFSPETGMPVSGDLQSVTVVTHDPVEGDALSTAFMVMGEAASLDLLRIIPGVEAIFISVSSGGKKNIVATGGLKKSMHVADSDASLVYHDIQ